MSGVQPYWPSGSLGFAPADTSLRMSLGSPSRAASISGESGREPAKQLRRTHIANTSALLMFSILRGNSVASSTFCYKVKRRPNLQIDHVFLFAEPLLDRSKRHEMNSDAMLRFAARASHATRARNRDLFRRDAGRGRAFREEIDAIAGVAGLFFQLALRGGARIVIALVADQSRRQIDDARLERF